MGDIPRFLAFTLNTLQRAVEADDFSTLGTINEHVQPVADAVVRRIRALRADVQRLQEERAKLNALAAELFDGVPTSPENALTWLHQEVMRALTTPNWPGVLVEILMERVRQIEKGYDAAHDDKLTAFELSAVAAAVTLGTVEHLPVSGDARELTGHIIEKWDIRRRLVIAAALVVAEIERLDRKQSGRSS